MAWQPIATYGADPLNPCPVVLRPHRVHGAMDVRQLTDDEIEVLQQDGVLSRGIPWRWVNGDMTTAWTDGAFLPYWMPAPAPPSDQPPDPDACRQSGHGRVVCETCGAAFIGVETVREKGDRA